MIYNNRLYNVDFSFVKVCIHFFGGPCILIPLSTLSSVFYRHCPQRHMETCADPKGTSVLLHSFIARNLHCIALIKAGKSNVLVGF